ncbi:GTP-binding protein REM 1-like [Uloborus diversus]|uniref:GTP-binding protein REM 1-like n=1 Tax=Uloborus diversus TaxID=327109 RepID=UPI00240A34A9|nr:GTP-binding protein REM 1-like [Uloborus diversus]
MSLQITRVHSPSDCDFCNTRTIAHSVPDLSGVVYCTSPPQRGASRSPRDTPSPSRSNSKASRSKQARHRRGRATSSTFNSATSLEWFQTREASPGGNDFHVGEGTPYRRRVSTMPSRTLNRQGPSDLSGLPDSSAYRLRSFSVTNRGSVVNLGDTVCFRSRSDVSVGGSGSSLGPPEDFRERTSSSGGSTVRSEDVPKYKVLVLGDEGVGKSSLIAQLMTSEYLTVRNALSMNDAQENSGKEAASSFVSWWLSCRSSEVEQDDSCGESVKKETDGSERRFEKLIGYRVPAGEFCSTDALVLVYSVTDMSSFRKVCHCLKTLKETANRQPRSSLPLGPGLRSKAVILVGNKADLARVRTVSTDKGRSIASHYDVKFIETSVVIHHNVDELLVGVLSQIRLKARQAAVLSCRHHARFTTRARSLWRSLLQRCELRFRSCDNLHL